MSTIEPAPAPPPYRDQSAGLKVFGILQILIGGFCGLMAPMMLLSTMLPPRPGGAAPLETRQAIPAAGLYLAIAAAGICLGIGSIKARRWAWALTVVLSWMWLIVGVLALGFFLLIGANALAVAQQQANVPREALLFIQVFTGGLMGCIYIVLPGAFLLFYQRYAVWATCRWRDPQPRWTDRCPLPVLALSILLGISATQMLVTAVYGVMPCFGVFLTGAAGIAAILLVGTLLAWLAWGIYRLKTAAWWGTFLFFILGTASAMVTFAQPNALKTMYEKMGMPPAQLEMMNKMGMADMMSRGFIWIMPITATLLIGYLIWVRRYFRVEEAEIVP